MNKQFPLSLVLAVGLFVSVIAPAHAATDGSAPSWRPTITEKLVKLPNAYLKKALDKDFGASPLAGAISDLNSEIQLKGQTLKDLQGASDQAQGELKVELDHQFLAEKKAYLDLVRQAQDLKRRHLKTRVKLYERMLKKMNRADLAQTKAQVELVEKQVAAQARFERTFDQVDLKLFEASIAPESRYAKEYAKNMSAITALSNAIEAHPMNQPVTGDGSGASKPDFVRQLLASAEGELALLGQEQEIAGFMAKLVALDAQALAESVTEDVIDLEDEGDTAPGLAQAVDFFVQ